MNLRHTVKADFPALHALWNRRAPLEGYTKLTLAQMDALIFSNPYYNEAFSFVLETDGALVGFLCGAADSALPAGDERGYFSCLILEEAYNSEENAGLLLDALEKAFASAGRTVSDVLFFNPIRLPWEIPGTQGHTHNNMPGVWTQSPLHGWLLARGYAERARECAMYRDLSGFALSPRVLEKQERLAYEGYTIAPYDGSRHTGLAELLHELENAEWEQEISSCAKNGTLFLVAAHENRVAGFAGPVYPEPGGRGYFTGIGVSPRHEGHGLGSLLFHRLCAAEREAGAVYMSLFTGETNPAKKIYEGAGFRVVRTFGIMRKGIPSAAADGQGSAFGNRNFLKKIE